MWYACMCTCMYLCVSTWILSGVFGNGAALYNFPFIQRIFDYDRHIALPVSSLDLKFPVYSRTIDATHHTPSFPTCVCMYCCIVYAFFAIFQFFPLSLNCIFPYLTKTLQKFAKQRLFVPGTI